MSPNRTFLTKFHLVAIFKRHSVSLPECFAENEKALFVSSIDDSSYWVVCNFQQKGQILAHNMTQVHTLHLHCLIPQLFAFKLFQARGIKVLPVF